MCVSEVILSVTDVTGGRSDMVIRKYNVVTRQSPGWGQICTAEMKTQSFLGASESVTAADELAAGVRNSAQTNKRAE